MSILEIIGLRLMQLGFRARQERGEGLVTWVVLAVGLALAAAAVIAIISPAVRGAAEKVASTISGS
jgi:hypothetical protein